VVIGGRKEQKRKRERKSEFFFLVCFFFGFERQFEKKKKKTSPILKFSHPAELAPKSGARESAAVSASSEASARCWAWEELVWFERGERRERGRRGRGRRRSGLREREQKLAGKKMRPLNANSLSSSLARIRNWRSLTFQDLDAKKPYCFRAISRGGFVAGEAGKRAQLQMRCEKKVFLFFSFWKNPLCREEKECGDFFSRKKKTRKRMKNALASVRRLAFSRIGKLFHITASRPEKLRN